ncbi:hypothetical protein CV102_17270 [Natronococcus pandeyae]|uniref:DUF8139 domain-containing protein n=1 Tax=Natronococcus pandeyae TaxID=2055836 RepID=A0A8J8PZL0_9EURY|nr:hypothetical protein CV102_17270 [Natronococcus pandeyae]
MSYIVGDPVRVDIPDETNPYHLLHGEEGFVLDSMEDGYRIGLIEVPVTFFAYPREVRPSLRMY